jgi:hypothetical protein
MDGKYALAADLGSFLRKAHQPPHGDYEKTRDNIKKRFLYSTTN